MANRDVVALLLDRLGKPWSLVRHVEDRPGHDRRYAMDGTRSSATLGWRPRTSFEDGLAATVDWFVANEAWWRAARGPATGTPTTSASTGRGWRRRRQRSTDRR